MLKLRKANRTEKKDFPNAVATITIGRHEAQLTQKDIDLLHSKLNKFAIHSVSKLLIAFWYYLRHGNDQGTPKEEIQEGVDVFISNL
jgi:hypothetical protein